MEYSFGYFHVFKIVYDRNHYFGLGPIPKPKLANTFCQTDTKTTF